jgi:hypothetical protein
MEISNTKRLALAMLMVAIILISGSHEVSAQCQASVPALISQCSKFVQKVGPKIPPSADCCAVVKGIDIPCVCNLITKAIENIISFEKVVYVGRTCGLTIKSGTKCGSKYKNSNFFFFKKKKILGLINSIFLSLAFFVMKIILFIKVKV